MLHQTLSFLLFLAFCNRCLAAPATGSCLCVTASSVHVRAGAGLHATILGSATTGDCYIFKGQTHVADGYTWYEIAHAFGHATKLCPFVSVCCQPRSDIVGTAAACKRFSYFYVPQESGCRPLGCHMDVGSNSCGYFQIKHAYWLDCGSPGSSWESCSSDKHCSSLCVQNYMKRYAAHYHCPMTCEGFAREHNGGPQGCHHSGTVGYWTHLQSHAGCHNVQ